MLMTPAPSTRPPARWLWTALQVDLAHKLATDEKSAKGRRPDRPADAGHQGRAHRQGLRQRVNAQQVFGGHGYIAEHGAWSSSCAMRASP
jgi:hypothetical protein